MSNAEITSSRKGIAISSSFPKERGAEKACSARRGSRAVIWYVVPEFPDFGLRLLYSPLSKEYNFLKSAIPRSLLGH